jgi:anti-anti-sigma factor
MFTCHIINEEAHTMVFPEGELGYEDCHALKDIVSGHIGPGVCLSFNMGKVSFLDSAGVGLLVQMKNMAEKRNGSFEMHHLPKRVKIVIDRLALNEFLNVSKDETGTTTECQESNLKLKLS